MAKFGTVLIGMTLRFLSFRCWKGAIVRVVIRSSRTTVIKSYYYQAVRLSSRTTIKPDYGIADHLGFAMLVDHAEFEPCPLFTGFLETFRDLATAAELVVNVG